jgi:hypothetical protein
MGSIFGRQVVWLAVALGLIAAPAWAQGTLYKYTRIADTVKDAGLAGVSCVGLNNQGTVIVVFVPAGSPSNQLWRGSGGAFTAIASSLGGICASINALGHTAYLVPVPGTGHATLVKNANGTLTTLAEHDTPPELFASTVYLPSLNDGGSAVYTGGATTGSGIYIGPSGASVYNSLVDPPLDFFVSPASMNNSHVAVYGASRDGVQGVYRESAMPVIRSGDAVSGGIMVMSGLQRPVISDTGTVGFTGRLDESGPGSGVFGVYTTTDGASVTRVGTSPVDRISINNSGAVVYRRTLSGGAGSGIYIGRPGALDQPVIEQGATIDGSTLANAFIWEESLNDKGQVAFWANLADGRWGIYRADPVMLKSVSFTQKIPGCGPINGKVTLTAAAPAGGVTVSLESSNAAASVPSTVTVAAGKQAATFPITPTAVLSNSVGAVTATLGPQTLTRALTVRPITVAALALAPNPVVGGNAVTGTVTLDCGAAPANISVALSSTKPTLAHPNVSSLLFPVGTKTLTFSIATSSVTAATTATIKASSAGTTKSKKLTINP